jgi:hypothetical protein
VTLLYRAVWQDSGLDATASLDEEFRKWCGTKGFHPEQIPERGSISIPGKKVAQVRRLESESARAILCTLQETDGPKTWTTTATALSAGDSQTFWVDLACVDESNQRVDIAAPRLVRALLSERGVAPTYDGENVKPSVTVIAPKDCEALAAKILDPDRQRPIVVFSPDRTRGPKATHERALVTATDTAGIAGVYVLMPDAERTLQQFIPEGFWVYGGAVRLYLPGVDPENQADAVRHQVVSRRVIEVHSRRAASIIARRIAQSDIHPVVPAEWGLIQSSLRRPTDEEIRGKVGELEDQHRNESEVLELLAVAELEVAEKDGQIQELRSSAVFLENQHIDDVAEIEELQREQRILKQMLKNLLDPSSVEVSEMVRPADLEPPDSVLDAIELAREHLPLLVIPSSAERDIENMDEGYKGRVWGEGVWEGLLALQGFAAAKASGEPVHGFRDWCIRTGAWPKNKISMSESDTVVQDAKLRGQRRFKVSTDVSSDGFVVMEAHLKIQIGGGNNIPRVYFHDDTDGPTGKFHIGFIGPHYLVENTKS